MPAQSHRSDPRILRRRTLPRDHRCLAAVLRPGHSVLDIGCGTGAITAGIAAAVGPQGSVTGIDRDETLLELARAAYSVVVPNMHFARCDATALPFPAQFDIVTAARTLQWIADPGLAVLQMARVVKPGGMLVILDYNHADNRWEPDPPREFQRFYDAFLAWREANRWDNRMADRLPELLHAAGLIDIESHIQDEIVERGQPDFAERADLWPEVIDSVGPRIAAAGLCTDAEPREARVCYEVWVKTDLRKQTLAMRGVTGTCPAHQQ